MLNQKGSFTSKLGILLYALNRYNLCLHVAEVKYEPSDDYIQCQTICNGKSRQT